MTDALRNAEATYIKEKCGVQTERLSAVRDELGTGTAEALCELLSVYDDGLCAWLLGLWEPNIGGFYYSNSARDNEGFLPDVESTAQALLLIKGSGLLSARGNTPREALPEGIKKSIVRFVKSLQDPEDGYFYHPQWGKEIIDARRDRDYSWATSLLADLGATPDHLTAAEHLRRGDRVNLPEHFSSPDAFKKYLINLIEEKPTSYKFGNTIASQSSEIKAAGEEYTNLLISFLNERQNPENGLWEDEVRIASINGMMTLTKLYNAFGAPLPHAREALDSAIFVASSDEIPATVCQFYNPWLTLSRVLENKLSVNDGDSHREFLRRIRDAAPAAILNTAKRVRRFKKDDGSFSYLPDRTSPVSQNASVALPDMNEGDMNASAVSTVGTLNSIYSALKIESVPIFSRSNSEAFLSALEGNSNERN